GLPRRGRAGRRPGGLGRGRRGRRWRWLRRRRRWRRGAGSGRGPGARRRSRRWRRRRCRRGWRWRRLGRRDRLRRDLAGQGRARRAGRGPAVRAVAEALDRGGGGAGEGLAAGAELGAGPVVPLREEPGLGIGGVRPARPAAGAGRRPGCQLRVAVAGLRVHGRLRRGVADLVRGGQVALRPHEPVGVLAGPLVEHAWRRYGKTTGDGLLVADRPAHYPDVAVRVLQVALPPAVAREVCRRQQHGRALRAGAAFCLVGVKAIDPGLRTQATALAGGQALTPRHVLPGVVGVELDLDPETLQGREVGVGVGRAEAEHLGVEGKAPPHVADDEVQRDAGKGRPVLAWRQPWLAGALFRQLDSLRLAGSRSSSRGRVIFTRERMISISFFRPLGGPIMMAPTRRSSQKKSLRKNFSSYEQVRTDSSSGWTSGVT